MSTNAIEAEGLIKHYPGDVRALDGLSFAVQQGTVFGLLGPNGAGKSTTVKILTTLARADAGAARVAGHDVRRRRRRGCGRAIGVVAQKAGVDREATGRENLRLQGQPDGIRAARARAVARRAARALRPGGGRRPHRARLLGRHAAPAGRRARRSSTARSVLFLDEPTTGLDPEVRADMWQRDRAAGARRGHHGPAHHPLPRGGRPAGGASWRSSTAAASWRAARPTSSRRELRGDAVHVELERALQRRGARARSHGAGCARSTSTAARCARAPTTAPAPCPPCWRRSRRAASRWPR